MKAPLSWLREYAALGPEVDGRALAQRLIEWGHEVESIEQAGADVTGPLVVGRVLARTPEPQKNGKTINWCTVDVGEHNPEGEAGRGIVCGAHNFEVGDHVVVALAGAVLPGDFAISARKTYGHLSDGMICSSAELGLGDGGDGIIVLGDTADDGSTLTPGQDAAPVLHLRDEVLDVAVTPNLGFGFSIRGLARESADAFEVAFTDPVDRPVQGTVEGEGWPVQLETDACDTFVALTVDGFDATRPSPRWLQRRLHLAGMRPISLGVDVTNYVMLTTGQPLHGYDAARLQGAITVRTATPGERLVTLDGVERVLDAEDVVIADDSGPIGLAGVMGGASSELSADTTTVVIEAAHFAPVPIARTSRRHKLSSEASRRFERSVDPDASYAAARLAASLLVSLGGGRLAAGETMVRRGSADTRPVSVMAVDLPERILGTPVTANQVESLLQRSRIDVVRRGDEFTLTPPTWRNDLRDPYDYVEEVGRKLGFDTIEPILPTAPVGSGLTRSQRARRAVNQMLADNGSVEVLSLPWAATGDLDRIGVPADDPRRALVRLANPLADTAPFLRTTLLPGLLAAAARNVGRGHSDLALHEIGVVFRARAEAVPAPLPDVSRRPEQSERDGLDGALPEQPRQLGLLLTGNWLPAAPGRPAVAADWQHVIGLVRAAAGALGAGIEITAGRLAPWHPGRCAEIRIGGHLLGHAGELHPSVCAEFDLPERSCAAELDLDALIAAAPERGAVQALSSWPVAKLDIAVVVDAGVAQAEVEQALADGAGELLESIRLFDVYAGEQIEAGSKSLAYALQLRAPDRTLTDAEAIAVRDAAVARAAERTGAALRV